MKSESVSLIFRQIEVRERIWGGKVTGLGQGAMFGLPQHKGNDGEAKH